MDTATGKDVATVDEQSKALAAYNYGDEGDAGFDNQTQDDYKTPFLRVLQGLSPQVETVPGAKPGLIINTVTNELFSEVLFVPAITERKFVEWVPREEGGSGGAGFVGVHEAESDPVKRALKEDGKYSKHKVGDNDLVETFYVHGVLVNAETGDLTPAVVSFSSTGIANYQAWQSTARLQTFAAADGLRKSKPLYAHVYRLSTAKRTNKKGSFYNFAISFANGEALKSLVDPKSNLFQCAKDVREHVLKGDHKVDYAGAAGDPGDKTEQEIPF